MNGQKKKRLSHSEANSWRPDKEKFLSLIISLGGFEMGQRERTTTFPMVQIDIELCSMSGDGAILDDQQKPVNDNMIRS
jgi:hypothetical protein